MIINIDNIAFGGYGVGRLDGKAVFVDYAIPGDKLEVEFYSEKKYFSFAGISRIIEPSLKRKTPDCPNFGLCGGCSYLNTGYQDEIDYKVTILEDQLKRFSSLDHSYNLKIITDERYHYRSHSSIKYINNPGFYCRNSNRLIPFPDSGCLIISQKLNDGIKALDFDENTHDIKIAEDCFGNFYHNLYRDEILEERENNFLYSRSINGFFQGNKFLRKTMIETVCGYSELTEKDEFIDICSGCGFFSIPLSKMSSHGTGYDIDRNSINFAKKNAHLNQCDNLKFFQISESEINPFKIKPKTVIIDPPRSGISKRGRKTINAIAPEIIVYVSCNPSTFARDISDFFTNGYYLNEITLIDMFPCTHHIELIAKLSKFQR